MRTGLRLRIYLRARRHHPNSRHFCCSAGDPSREQVAIPSPALPEILVAEGADVQDIVTTLRGSAFIRIESFDERDVGAQEFQVTDEVGELSLVTGRASEQVAQPGCARTEAGGGRANQGRQGFAIAVLPGREVATGGFPHLVFGGEVFRRLRQGRGRETE
ncbi:hypothetical protein [Paludibaculum fermentans]|uniref:hypothetical protein n=1 Tax=Paludibaculum fermentans TaxID=1473598 RepID=UPI003EBCAF1B